MKKIISVEYPFVGFVARLYLYFISCYFVAVVFQCRLVGFVARLYLYFISCYLVAVVFQCRLVGFVDCFNFYLISCYFGLNKKRAI